MERACACAVHKSKRTSPASLHTPTWCDALCYRPRRSISSIPLNNSSAVRCPTPFGAVALSSLAGGVSKRLSGNLFARLRRDHAASLR